MNERYGNVRTEGTINLLGKNIYDPDVSLIELRKSVGMVFQRPNPLPISVYENIVFGLRVHKPRSELKRSFLDEAVEQALTEVMLWDDLKDNLKQKATELQLEQQQTLDKLLIENLVLSMVVLVHKQFIHQAETLLFLKTNLSKHMSLAEAVAEEVKVVVTL